MASIDLLEVLKLKNYYPRKLCFSEAIKLRGTHDTCSSEDQYGFEIIRRLLMFDVNGVITVTKDINKRLNSTNTKETEVKGHRAGVISATQKTNVRPSWKSGIAEQSERKLHPMDLLVVVMNCCDDFLRQVLVEKMFVNKLSIPILLPSARNASYTLLLFALRSVFPEVQDRIIGECPGLLFNALVDIENPLVSFIRVGDLHRSKSKMINELLGFNVFNTFFHRECQNGSAKRLVGNGCIEAAWFQSEKATEEEFNCNLLTALNLRENARDYPKQTKLLCQSSTLVVFMVDSLKSFKELYENYLKDVEMSNTKIIVCYISPKSPDNIKDKYYVFLESLSTAGVISVVKYDWLNGTMKSSDTEFVNDLKKEVSDILAIHDRDSKQVQTYATFSRTGENLGFPLDEDKTKYEITEYADKLVDLVFKQKLNCKTLILPMQGKPWEKIGKLQREKRGKFENKNQGEYFIAEMETEKRRQRGIQCHSFINQNEAIHTFCLKFQEQNLLYYINSCKIKLNARSRAIAASLKEDFEKWKLANQAHLSMNQEDYENELSKLELNIANSTIGMEHILREVGQIYEAVLSEEIRMKEELKSARLAPADIGNFPAIVAKLMLMGQSLELMDGDTSNVPISWMKDALNQIRIETKNAKVFVLSIIGVQSSGKSTLLNALFGLQFPVSAGRCTKGIYCHLVPVDRERFGAEYDYVLVVDTEGLGSSHLRGKSTFRDNELATFAIGLADATIINMKGENWAELKDILQVVAHGLILVRKTKTELKLMPSCVFVYQNVPAPNAKEMNQLGQEKQLMLFDAAIKDAGRAEGFKEIIKFDQVIWYDSDWHSWYFPDLWNGKPPKARISQDYTNKAHELSRHLRQLMTTTTSKLTLSSYFLRMSDLWNAMLHNDFVLGFRNTQEILSGTILNDRISNEVDRFNNLNRLEQIKMRETICSILSIEELDRELISGQVRKAVIENFTNMTTFLKDIIDAADICEDLKTKYESSLNKIRDEELRRIEDETEYDISVQIKKFDICNDQNVKQLMERLRNLEKCTDEMEKVKFSETDMKDFEEKWERLVAENKSLLDIRMKNVQETIQFEILNSVSKLVQELEIKSFNGADVVKTPFSDVSILQASERDIVLVEETSVLGFVWSKSLDVNMVYNSLCDTIKRWNLKFQNKSGQDFDASHWKQIMSEVGQMLGIRGPAVDKCSVLPPGYKFSEDYNLKLVYFVFNYLYNRCLENSTRFISMTDPLADICERQRKSLSSYRMLLAEVNIDVVCETIFDCAKNYLVKNLGELMKREVIKEDNKNSTFKTKRDFLKTILTDLGKRKHNLTGGNAEKNDIFKDFMLYIEMAESTVSEDFFLGVICKLLKEMLAKDSVSETDIQKVVINYVGNFVDKAKAALRQAETKCNESTMEYFRIFKEEMNLTDEICLRIHTLPGFTQAVLGKLDILFGEYLSQANSLFDALAYKDDKAALRPLFEKIMGCRERCPFCKAPCFQSLQGHPEDHRANHYPMGVRGTVDIWHLFSDTKQTHDATDEKGGPKPLTLDTCQTMVGSRADFRTKVTVNKYKAWYHKAFNWNYHSFKSYKEFEEYAKWDIPHSQDHSTSLYWKWFMAQFAKELAEHYKAVCPSIPEAWTQITWEEAKESLNEPDYSDSISLFDFEVITVEL